MWYVDNPYSVGVYFIRNVGTYLILLSNFVPISLWVTIELIKVGQSKFMSPYHHAALLSFLHSSTNAATLARL
jgi:magnesium-transporting ATPase (P-type)